MMLDRILDAFEYQPILMSVLCLIGGAIIVVAALSDRIYEAYAYRALRRDRVRRLRK